MSKVICDVCGTTYPETASVCPICGSAKNTTAQTAADSTPEENAPYTYVKGGRFSKSNVRKRNQNKKLERTGGGEDSESDGGNKGLIIVVLILLLAIVAVLIYIGVQYFAPGKQPDDPVNPGTTQQTNASTAEPTQAQISCTSIKLDDDTIQFSVQGSAWLLSATVEPQNTTDKLTFTSADERIATVSETGNVTAVGGGETEIIVRCGTQEARCKVVCSFGTPPEPTDPTDPTVMVPSGFVLKLNRKDFTLSKPDEFWQLFKETDGVKPSDITWTVDDPKVAKVEDGKVTGVDYGDTKVHATLGDQTVSCDVRVRFHAQQGGDTPPADGPKINKTDVTIEIGEPFTLTLSDANGAKINVTWTASEEGYVTIDGTRITGVASTQELEKKSITISAEYEGKTYSCIVRVKKPAEDPAT